MNSQNFVHSHSSGKFTSHGKSSQTSLLCSLTVTLWTFWHEVVPLSLIGCCWFLFVGWGRWEGEVGFNFVIFSLSFPGK